MRVLILLLLLVGVISIYNNERIQEITSLDELLPIIVGQTDFLSMVLFLHEDCSRCHQMEDIVVKFAEQYSDYIKIYAIDCQIIWTDENNHQSIPMCNPKFTQDLPMISFFEPPAQKINPYTNRPMQPKEHKYQGSVSVKDFSNFVKGILPAYRQSIKSIEQLEKFIADPLFDYKVLLVSNKKETSNLYKGLTAYFRDRIEFGEILDASEEISKQLGTTKFPTLYVLHQGQQILYEGDLKFDTIVQFLDKYALQQKKERPAQKADKEKKNTQQEQQKKKREIEVKTLDTKRYERQVLSDNSKPYLIHLYDKKNNQSHASWEEIKEKYQGMFELYQLDISSEENRVFAETQLFVAKFPSIKYLPYEAHKKSTNKIYFGPQLLFDQIKAEISEFISDHSISVNEQMLQVQLNAGLQQNLIVLLLFYNNEQPPLAFRALTHEEQYKKKFLFLSYRNAPKKVTQQFGVQEVPKIVIIFRDLKKADEQTEELKQEDVKVAHFQGKIVYQDLSPFLNQFIQLEEGKSDKNIQEIKTQEDFRQLCQEKYQSCFISLINASPDNRIEREKEDSIFDQQQKIIEKVKDRYGSRPIGFAWIDAICHSEILGALNLAEDEIPNMIQYSNTLKQYSKLIGRFDLDSLNHFVGSALQNKVTKYSLNLDEFQIREKDCEEVHNKLKQQANSAKVEEEDDEILREILEESRRKEQERLREEEEEKKRRKDKKKKKKSKSDL